MKYSISNIAWTSENDAKVYKMMKELGYTGLEIAPTRIFPENPYEHIEDASKWANELKNEYGFEVASMQSIWYGRNEKIFGSVEERCLLMEYTKKAINFAAAIGCGNLVFGCPKNRCIQNEYEYDIAVIFFRELAEYAEKQGTCIGMEANPPIYNTNFINTTLEAFQLIGDVGASGFKINLDIGTMIVNGETIDMIEHNLNLVNHVHISEPGLKEIMPKDIHIELIKRLEKNGYEKYISIEMGNSVGIDGINNTLKYVKELEEEKI